MPNTLTYDLGEFSFDLPSVIMGPTDGLGWGNPAGASEPTIWGPIIGDAFGRLFETDNSSGEQVTDSAHSDGLILDLEKLLGGAVEELAESININLDGTFEGGIIDNFIQTLFPGLNANDLFGQFQSGSAGEVVEALIDNVGDDLPELVNDIAFGLSDLPGVEAVVDQLTGLQGGELLLPNTTEELTSLVDNLLQVGESVLSKLEASDLPASEPFLDQGAPVATDVMNQELAPVVTQEQKLSSESFEFEMDGGIAHLGSGDAGLMAAPTIENRKGGGIVKPSNSTELFWWQPPGGIGTWEVTSSAL